MYRRLSDIFSGAAGKTLVAVETDFARSHQHEFNGVKNLEALFGPTETSVSMSAAFVYLDDTLEPLSSESTLTWYDARARARNERGVMRWEYRLYYQPNDVMNRAKPGDLAVIAREMLGRVLVLVCAAGTSVELQARQLFEVSADAGLFEVDEDLARTLDFTTSVLLEALGYETAAPDFSAAEVALARLGGAFPTTREFSALARDLSGVVDEPGGADDVLLAWWNQEEALFRALERQIVTPEFADAYGDVDKTLQVAQRTFQRRKARAGQALENHFEQLLIGRGIPYSRGAETEGHKKPDFLFPGGDAYRDPTFPADRLVMLGVKTTCKDRWRQVLNEADRIPRKHLLTLEAPISSSQVEEMVSAGLTLVIPRSAHKHFAESTKSQLFDVERILMSLDQSD